MSEDREVYLRSVERVKGGGSFRDPGEIIINLEASCVDPSDVTVGEIITAVKRGLMVWEPTKEGDGDE